ncbi:MAG: dihydrofolate reductase [Candidatus Saccharibacteria bacterium]|nr:dihydrofolate reductase [Candidatus Saccharibacteria bacterium]
MIRLIAAVDRNLGIAKHGFQPWNIPADEQYFRQQTTGHAVLMGSKTYEVIGRPLPDRRNFVASFDAVAVNGAEVVNDVEAFLSKQQRDIWVIGGASIYEQALPYADELYLTHIEADFGCDKFFPQFQQQFMLFDEQPPMEENGFIYRYIVYTSNRSAGE